MLKELNELVNRLRKIKLEQQKLSAEQFQVEQKIRDEIAKRQDPLEVAARDEIISQLVERLVK